MQEMESGELCNAGALRDLDRDSVEGNMEAKDIVYIILAFVGLALGVIGVLQRRKANQHLQSIRQFVTALEVAQGIESSARAAERAKERSAQTTFRNTVAMHVREIAV